MNSRTRRIPLSAEPRPEFRLELVPDLGKRLVGTKLCRVMGEDLLVGHPQGHVRVPTVLESKHLFADRVPAAGLLPDLLRMETGQPELLGPDPLHLLADDRLDLPQAPKGERRHRVATGHQLADVARPHEELVAHGLGVGGVVSQGRNEGARPAQGILLGLRGRSGGSIASHLLLAVTKRAPTPELALQSTGVERGSSLSSKPPRIRSKEGRAVRSIGDPSRDPTGTRPARVPVKNTKSAA